MIHKKYEITGASSFDQFRKDSINLISSINSTAASIIRDIEKNVISVDEKVTLLDNYITELAAIYTSFHSMPGTETVIKMKSMLNNYIRDSEHNQKRIYAAGYLLTRLRQMVEDNNFSGPEPFRSGPFSPGRNIKKFEQGTLIRSQPYKWITFRRNNSWFIAEFSCLEIISIAGAEMLQVQDGMLLIKTVNNAEYRVMDLMRKPSDFRKPLYLIKFHNNGFYYAADKKGKEIYSSRDFISPMIERFTRVKNLSLNGRVRLFGLNHLYIINIQCSVESANKNCAGA